MINITKTHFLFVLSVLLKQYMYMLIKQGLKKDLKLKKLSNIKI